MMDARESMGTAIGDVATSAQFYLTNKVAAVAEKPSGTMRANGAVGPTAPTAIVSNGRGELTVLSGRQSSAPMASPSH